MTTIDPLPIRRRAALEVLDVALKLYRRYFVVLTGWALALALANVVSIIAPFVVLLLSPLFYAAVSCVTAAAVRGQGVCFGQVWKFCAPRYGALLGVLLVATLLALVFGALALFAVVMMTGLVTMGLGSVLSNMLGVVVLGVLWLLVSVVLSLLGSLLMAWVGIAPIVVCLEDDQRGLSALMRAASLMHREGWRVIAISFLVALSGLFLASVVIVMVASVYGLLESWIGGEFWLLAQILVWALATVATVCWVPAQALTMAVLYLDLRTRKEALDLEWLNYEASAAASNSSSPSSANQARPPEGQSSQGQSRTPKPEPLPKAGPNATWPDAAGASSSFAPALELGGKS